MDRQLRRGVISFSMTQFTWQLMNSTLWYVQHWLHDWGDLVLTGVIAWAAIMQWIVSSRLLGLSTAIEEYKNEPHLYCRLKGNTPYKDLPCSSIDAELSNLSSFGIWIDGAIVVLDGQVACKPRLSIPLDTVLRAGETYSLPLFSQPFAEIVTIGSQRLTLRIQVKFNYSTSHRIGVQVSPIYLMTVDHTVVTEFVVESDSAAAS